MRTVTRHVRITDGNKEMVITVGREEYDDDEEGVVEYFIELPGAGLHDIGGDSDEDILEWIREWCLDTDEAPPELTLLEEINGPHLNFGGMDVGMHRAQPNPMFSEFVNAATVFLAYRKPVECALCKAHRLRLWTMAVFFRACSMNDQALTLDFSESPVFPPLTPVCSDHILNPCVDTESSCAT